MAPHLHPPGPSTAALTIASGGKTPAGQKYTLFFFLFRTERYFPLRLLPQSLQQIGSEVSKGLPGTLLTKETSAVATAACDCASVRKPWPNLTETGRPAAPTSPRRGAKQTRVQRLPPLHTLLAEGFTQPSLTRNPPDPSPPNPSACARPSGHLEGLEVLARGAPRRERRNRARGKRCPGS